MNKVNGNMYVGSSVDLRERLYVYYSLLKLNKSNRTIDRALLKYGYSKFSFEILEYCTRENVLEREQYYMDLIKPVYNIVEKAGSTLGYRHTEATKEKMRNLKLSKEVLKVKLESVTKASEANRVKVIVVNIETGEETEYLSMTEASVALGVHKNTIGNAIKNQRVMQKRFICLLSDENIAVITDRIQKAKAKLKIKPGNSSRVEVIVENIETKEKTVYPSMVEAGKAIGVDKSTISKAIRNGNITKRKFLCRYLCQLKKVV